MSVEKNEITQACEASGGGVTQASVWEELQKLPPEVVEQFPGLFMVSASYFLDLPLSS